MSGFRILLVDDDRAIHEVAGEYLQASGFDVSHAGDGTEALEVLDTRPTDLVLLDIQMPGMDGFQALRLIRQRWDVPVLFLSSLSRSNLKVKGLELGADDYIVKPFDRAELLARVKAALRRTRRFHELQADLSGRTEEVGIATVMQTLELSGKAARISLPDLPATIELGNGGVVSATFRTFEGIEALRRIFLLERGPFSVSFLQGEAPGSPIPLKEGLLDVYVYVDEVGRALSGVAARTATVARGPSAPSEPDWLVDLYERCHRPVGLMESLAELPGDILENLQTLVASQEAFTISGASQ